MRQEAELEWARKQIAELGQRLRQESEKRRQVEAVCKQRLDFETLLSELSACFVNLPADQAEKTITSRLSSIFT